MAHSSFSYNIENLKVMDIEGKEIVKFAFGTWYFDLYDPRSICKDQCARIHFQWIIRAFYWPVEDPRRNLYNAYKHCEPVSLVATSQATPQRATTLEETVEESSNPMHDKGKRKIVDSPGREQSCKMKEDPIMKATLVFEVKRKHSVTTLVKIPCNKS